MIFHRRAAGKQPLGSYMIQHYNRPANHFSGCLPVNPVTNRKRPAESWIVREIAQLVPACLDVVWCDGSEVWTEPVQMVAVVRQYRCDTRGRERVDDAVIPFLPADVEWLTAIDSEWYMGMVARGVDPLTVDTLDLPPGAKLVSREGSR